MKLPRSTIFKVAEEDFGKANSEAAGLHRETTGPDPTPARQQAVVSTYTPAGIITP